MAKKIKSIIESAETSTAIEEVVEVQEQINKDDINTEVLEETTQIEEVETVEEAPIEETVTIEENDSENIKQEDVIKEEVKNLTEPIVETKQQKVQPKIKKSYKNNIKLNFGYFWNGQTMD